MLINGKEFTVRHGFEISLLNNDILLTEEDLIKEGFVKTLILTRISKYSGVPAYVKRKGSLYDVFIPENRIKKDFIFAKIIIQSMLAFCKDVEELERYESEVSNLYKEHRTKIKDIQKLIDAEDKKLNTDLEMLYKTFPKEI